MMNEIYCMNKIMEELGSIRSWLRFIDEDFLIPIWIIAIALALIALTWTVLGIMSGIIMIKSTRMMYAQFDNSKADIKKIIRKAQRKAKRRKEELEHEETEEL